MQTWVIEIDDQRKEGRDWKYKSEKGIYPFLVVVVIVMMKLQQQPRSSHRLSWLLVLHLLPRHLWRASCHFARLQRSLASPCSMVSDAPQLDMNFLTRYFPRAPRFGHFEVREHRDHDCHVRDLHDLLDLPDHLYGP